MLRSDNRPTDLPIGWTVGQLGELCQVRGGGRLGLTKSDYRESGTLAYSAAGPDGFVDVEESDEPSIILSSIGARCGKCFLATGPWTTLANTQIITPVLTLLNPVYLHVILNDESYWKRSGSAQPFIKPSDVKRAFIPVPPLAQQDRIAGLVTAIDRVIDCTGRIVRTGNSGDLGKLQEVKNSVLNDVLCGRVAVPA